MLDTFSIEDKVNNELVIRTYIHDTEQNYIVILEPQKSGQDYYLITAYPLNAEYGAKAISKKKKKRLPELH